MRVYICVCVKERERQSLSESKRKSARESEGFPACLTEREKEYV